MCIRDRANSVDLEEFLRQRGEKLLRAGRESRLARVHHITVRGNEWYDHIARQGGHAVSFVQHYYCLLYTSLPANHIIRGVREYELNPEYGLPYCRL